MHGSTSDLKGLWSESERWLSFYYTPVVASFTIYDDSFANLIC